MTQVGSQMTQFTQWGKSKRAKFSKTVDKAIVIYTRVSSKEQALKNLSLDSQMNVIKEEVERYSLSVLATFGGTFESAKTDGRNEFNRMLDFIKKHKQKVTHIYVYTLDRFSRTGGAAIKLVNDLREKYGVEVYAVTQPIDTTNDTGRLNQNMQLLFSHHENSMRRQKSMEGTKTKSERGFWCYKPPIGYDRVIVNGTKEIRINKTGEFLKKAFEWKAGGATNELILERLAAHGINLIKQRLSKTFSNPFYAGVIVHRSLQGKAVKGQHPALISQELFMKVNKVRREAGGKYGVSHTKEYDTITLKVFMKCAKCGNPFTGYRAKQRENLWYYKCRTKGCGCNKNAEKVNQSFLMELRKLSIDDKLVTPLLELLLADFEVHNKDKAELEKSLRVRLDEVGKKIETMQEKFLTTDGIDQSLYNKFLEKYTAEMGLINQEIANTHLNSSNIKNEAKSILEFACKLPSAWTFSNTKGKEALQKLVFPDGIVLDTENNRVLTNEISPVFQWIADRTGCSGSNEGGQNTSACTLSPLAERMGFEPTIPCGIHTFQACSFNHSDTSLFEGEQK
jgi:site-specific DNA recombinase